MYVTKNESQETHHQTLFDHQIVSLNFIHHHKIVNHVFVCFLANKNSPFQNTLKTNTNKKSDKKRPDVVLTQFCVA